MMVIIDASVDATDTKKRDSLIGKLLGENAKSVKEIISLGKKVLKYPIIHKTEGTYVLVKITGNPVHVGDIQRQAKLMPDIIRFLLVSCPV